VPGSCPHRRLHRDPPDPEATSEIIVAGLVIPRFFSLLPITMSRPSMPTRSPLLRSVAIAMAAIMALVTLAAASPALHAWLHGHDDPPGHSAPGSSAHVGCKHSHGQPVPGPEAEEDHCIVKQLSQGKAHFASAPLLLQVSSRRVTAALSLAQGPAAREPAFLLPPGCGPPAV